MKIALANFNHSDRVLGGVETRYELLARALSSAGHQCVMVSTEFQVFEQIAMATYGIDLAVVDSAVGLALPCPMITVFGNPWRAVLSLGPNEHLERIMEREITWHQKFDSVRVAVSDYVAAEVRGVGLRCDLVVPNPADLDRFTEHPPKYRPPAVLWAGPEIAVKHPEMFWALRADEKFSGVQWLVADRSGEGVRSRDEMTETMLRSRVVLRTSWAEGCSNLLMEAFAADVPVVASRAGMFWDQWDERLGIRVDVQDASAYAAALLDVLDDPDRFRPRLAAVEHRWDYDTWAERWVRLVDEVAG